MADHEHLRKLANAVPLWNQWRKQNPSVRPDLSGADLSDRRNLATVDFTGANLSNVTLSGANLDGASLSGANLRETKLLMVNLSGAILRGADLTNARIFRSIFADTDLTDAEGLESCIHVGRSSLGIDTLFKSGGSIPEAFLRGCGVPEQLIAYARSLIVEAIDLQSCFISHSAEDDEFAALVHRDLLISGVRCWFAPHDVRGGRKLHEQIDDAIRIHDRALLILSEASMTSEWVKTEIAHARQKEIKEHRRVLFPIRLVPFEMIRDWECFDADTGKDSAREIREYFIPDFSNWRDHDSYQLALQRLVRDLKAEDRRPTADR